MDNTLKALGQFKGFTELNHAPKFYVPIGFFCPDTKYHMNSVACEWRKWNDSLIVGATYFVDIDRKTRDVIRVGAKVDIPSTHTQAPATNAVDPSAQHLER